MRSSQRVLIDYAATIRKAINNTWTGSHACNTAKPRTNDNCLSLCPGVDNLSVPKAEGTGLGSGQARHIGMTHQGCAQYGKMQRQIASMNLARP